MRAAILFVACLAACKPKPPPPPRPPVIDEIHARWEQVLPPSLPVPSDAALNDAVMRAAQAVPGVLRVAMPPPPGSPTMRLAVEVEVGWPGKPPLKSIVRAHLQPIGEAPGARIDREGLVEKEEVSGVPTAELIAAHLDHALALVVGSAMHAEQLWLGPAAEARAPLEGSDEELRDEAIRIAATHRDRDAVPALLKLLKQDDPELRDRAIGALADIGDPRAAHALAALAKFGDVQELMKIIDAISRVGGPEAESYLELVISGHPSQQVRDIAKKALEHAHKRAVDAGR